MASYGISDKGRARASNQDYYLTAEKNGAELVVVCDGIGGHRGGDVASKLACEAMVSHFRRYYNDNPEAWLKQALKRVNKLVNDKASQFPELKGMGTTMVAAVKAGEMTHVINVGDSRAYKFTREKELVQITEDHSYVHELVKYEGIPLEVAKNYGQHVITRAVGIWPVVEGDLFSVENNYKYMMLCTDGLHNYVSEENFVTVLGSRLSGENKCLKLMELANAAGGYDNITAVLIEG